MMNDVTQSLFQMCDRCLISSCGAATGSVRYKLVRQKKVSFQMHTTQLQCTFPPMYSFIFHIYKEYQIEQQILMVFILCHTLLLRTSIVTCLNAVLDAVRDPPKYYRRFCRKERHLCPHLLKCLLPPLYLCLFSESRCISLTHV